VNGVRLSVLPVGADAATVVAVAESADRAGIDGLWFGGLGAGSGVGVVDDAYVMTALCGAASRSRDIRLGALLDLAPDRAPLTSAEDIGVLDQASGGRLELGLVPAEEVGWVERAALILGAWSDWPVAGYDVAVTPRPAQPLIPRLVLSGVGGSAAIRERLRAGALILDGPGDQPVPGERRVLVSTRAVPDGRDAGELSGYIAVLRDEIEVAAADEVIVAVPAAAGGDEQFIALLAGVLAPVLRCPREEVPVLLHDALTWWRRWV
jgi:alkanesulfonate monooxygenase SsuD/methylene tetrahydromethanopterin reductase-like flavin-dependent oxidoreductase (luciferase family)